MENLVKEGLVRSIGVSNFNSKQLQEVIDNSTIKPAVNQVELHPYLSQEKLVDFCSQRGVAITAYSPFGSPDRPWAAKGEPVLLDDPKLKELADKYSKTPAQVWLFNLLRMNTSHHYDIIWKLPITLFRLFFAGSSKETSFLFRKASLHQESNRTLT